MSNAVNIGFAVKVKQGDILKALRERHWNQAQGAEFLGITQNAFCALINLRIVPKRPSEQFQQRLLQLTGKLYEDLFPEFVTTREFQKLPREFEFYREMDAPTLFYATQGLLPTPEEILEERQEVADALRIIAETLTPREEQILRMRRESMGWDEIGTQFHVSRERARQIGRKAMEKVAIARMPRPVPPIHRIQNNGKVVIVRNDGNLEVQCASGDPA